MAIINLLPTSQKIKIQKAKTSQIAASLGVFWLVFLVILTLLIFSYRLTLASSLKANLSQKEFLEKEMAENKDIAKMALFINDRLESIQSNRAETHFSVFVDELVTSTPSALQITNFSLSLKTKPQLKIQGLAGSRREVVKLMEKLEVSSYFKDMTFVTSNLAQGQVVFTIEGNAEKIP